jgi:hypothetical protein
MLEPVMVQKTGTSGEGVTWWEQERYPLTVDPPALQNKKSMLKGIKTSIEEWLLGFIIPPG